MIRNTIYMIMLLLCFSGLLGCGEQDLLEIQNGQPLDAAEPKQQEKDQAESDKKPAEIYVQVSGAVASPGVYPLPEGSRVFEAVQLAGGITKEADIRQMNQAEVLTDGQMIYVCTKEEAKAKVVQEQEQTDGKINLNTATQEQLLTLPGIGEAKAKSILSWREANGGFSVIEDLMQIEGIKEGVFSKIKDSVKVN